jgi:hypothetical protein
MANEGLINLLGWCGRQRETLQMQREMLQSGKFRISKDEGSGQVDASAENIGRITANIRAQTSAGRREPFSRATLGRRSTAMPSENRSWPRDSCVGEDALPVVGC